MLCPYCLRNTSSSPCKHCNETLTPLYVQQHRAFSKAPAILSAVGFSGHGKTVFLAALLYAMEKQLTRVWKGFFRQALDIESVQTVKANFAQLQQGELPQSTRRNFPRPSAHRLAKMPTYGVRDLLIYDPPGEAFDTDSGIERYAHFAQRARCVLFLVSLDDLPEPKGAELHRLLETYVLGMARLGARPKRQHLIVAYTKADLLINEFSGLSVTMEHLQNNYHEPILSKPRRYQRFLNTISDELATYTTANLGALNFANLAVDAFRSVVYCTVSALGAPPEDGHLVTAIQPRGVVDPLMWLLSKS